MVKRKWSAWPTRQEGALILGFWTLLALLLISSRVFGIEGAERDVDWFGLARITTTYALWALITPVVFWMAARYMLKRSNLVRRLPLHIGLALGVSLAVHVGSMLLCMHVFSIENPCPFNVWDTITRFHFLNEFMIYSAILATGFARVYYWQQRDREAEAQALRTQTAQLEAQLSKARLDALRMQLNPHFLFNTLHSVSTLVENDPKGVRRMIARLSDLLRYVLEENENQEIPLHQEMQYLQDYLDIQEVRFRGRFFVDEDMAPDVQDAMMPTFILQPIVENAVKHAAERHTGSTRIKIRAYRDDDMLVLSVSDNGGGTRLDVESITFGTGLSNVSARLEGLYGDAQQLTFRRAPEGGLEVLVRLPFHLEDDLFEGAGNGVPAPHELDDATIARHDD